MAAKNSKNNESRSKVKNFLAVACKWCKKGAQVIVGALALVFVSIVFFNPISFMLWALCSPAKAADAVYGCDVPVFGDILQEYCRPMIAILPFFAKKHFMALNGISNYSIRLQRRYYNNAMNKMETVKSMSRDAVAYLWLTSCYEDRKAIISAGATLTDKMFNDLLETSSFELAQSYVEKRTPSTKMVEDMLNHIKCCHNNEPAGLKLFLFSVKKHGLPTHLVVKAYDFAEYVDMLNQALQVYSQNQIRSLSLSETDGASWKNLVANEMIEVEVQASMAVWQYDKFHMAGQKLAKSAMVKLLGDGNKTMAERIFAYELDAVEENDLVVSIIKSNAELNKRFLEAKVAGK